MTQREAAEKMGVTARWVRKLVKRMEKEGDAVVVHGLRGRASNRKLSDKTQRQALAILKRRGCKLVGCPGLLGPPPSQIPQPARREDQGEAPKPAEHPEYPDEEKAAGGFGDLAIMCPPRRA